MESGALDVYDALSQINQVKYDNLDSALEGTKRSIEGVFCPPSAVSAEITDIFSTLSNEINAANGDFEKIGDAIGTAVGGITSVITEQLPVFLELGAEIISAIAGALVDNLPALIESGVGIVMELLNGFISALPQLTEERFSSLWHWLTVSWKTSQL